MRFDGILFDDRCERCAQLMSVRTMSYFTEETICADCVNAERALLTQLRLQGIDPATLAGCGQLPAREEDERRITVPA